jgi:ATP-dependent DNA helicase RecQ
MFKEGNSIEEIAEIRKFSPSTIEGHLSEYVRRGLLEVESVIDKNKVKIIREFMLENPDLKGTTLKEALGEEYSYGEIRMIYNSMNVEGN